MSLYNKHIHALTFPSFIIFMLISKKAIKTLLKYFIPFIKTCRHLMYQQVKSQLPPQMSAQQERFLKQVSQSLNGLYKSTNIKQVSTDI